MAEFILSCQSLTVLQKYLNILLRFDGRVLSDDAGARARCVEHDAIETFHDFFEFATVVRADDGVGHSQTMQVTDDGLAAVTVGVVGVEKSGVAHQGRDVSRLAAGGRGHVEDAFVLLRGQGHDGEHTGGSLEDVVSGQVFGGGSKGYLGTVDDEADLGPLAHGVEIHASIDESLEDGIT